MSKTDDRRREILGRDPTSQLYRAVIRYVESKGGKIIVIGGVQLQQWPEDFKYNFRLAVKCTGKTPELDAAKPKKEKKR